MSLWTPYSEEAMDLSVNKLPSFMEQVNYTLPSMPVFSLSENYSLPEQSTPSRMKNNKLRSFYNVHPYLQFQSLSPPQRVPEGEDYITPYFSPSVSPISPMSICDSSVSSSRPFKTVPARKSFVDADPSYAEFREAMLEAMRLRNGGSLTVSNPRMRRCVKRSLTSKEDAEYLERRAKNNAAAKRSRDIRRQKEDELAIRVAFLQRKIDELRKNAEMKCQYCFSDIET